MNEMRRPEDVERAEREVERRKAELSLGLRRAGESGERMAQRLGDQLKPALVGVGVLAGAAVLVGVAVLVARRRRRVVWSPPEQTSAASALLKSVGLALLRLAARQAARALLERVSVPTVPARSPAPAPAQ